VAATTTEADSPHLKAGAIGFFDSVVIGLASTAPAYSLAAIIGSTAVIAGVKVPAILWISFVPMFLIAAAFYYLNKVDPDCGTTFAWVTRAMGPWPGWIAGWAVTTTGILVVGSLADVAVKYFYILVGQDDWAVEKWAVMPVTVGVVLFMTLLCVLGTEGSAKLQNTMIVIQVGSLLLFAVVALVKVFGDSAPEGSVTPDVDWISPFGAGDLTAGLLLCVFAYWGWESSVNLSEESENPSGAGRAAVLSTIILLGSYVGVAFAVVAFAGPDALTAFDDDDSLLASLAGEVLGSPWDKLVVASVLTSALASTQTTIIPASRTVLSMARAGAMPERLSSIHERHLTPHVATWIVGISASAYYVVVNGLSENALFDTLSALALMIAFYYAMTGFACAWFYRRHLTENIKALLFVGVGPVVGSVLLTYLLGRSLIDLADPANSYSGSWLGLGPPFVIGVGFMLLGVVLMLGWRLRGPARFWSRRAERVDPTVARSIVTGGD
jgi:amino acid transporter